MSGYSELFSNKVETAETLQTAETAEVAETLQTSATAQSAQTSATAQTAQTLQTMEALLNRVVKRGVSCRERFLSHSHGAVNFCDSDFRTGLAWVSPKMRNAR